MTVQIFVYNVYLQMCFSVKGKKTHETFHIFETSHFENERAFQKKQTHFENERTFRKRTTF